MKPFAPDIFTGEGAATRLIASRCGVTGRVFHPAVPTCPFDGATAERIILSPDATLYSHTVVRMKPPFGLPSPYAVGYVDLPEGLRLYALLDPDHITRYRIGLPLILTSGPLGVDLDGAACSRPYYTLRVD